MVQSGNIEDEKIPDEGKARKSRSEGRERSKKSRGRALGREEGRESVCVVCVCVAGRCLRRAVLLTI